MRRALVCALYSALLDCSSALQPVIQPMTEKGCTIMSSEAGTDYAKASAGGMTFEWRIEGDVMKGHMTGPTLGWVAVGFNREKQLKGTRLIMGYVQNGRTIVEEHIVDPPDHKPKSALGGTSGVICASGTESGGKTTIEFTLKLGTGDSFDVPLVRGGVYYTTFAWSHEDDLYHHSAMRTAMDLTL
jgi:hypothetical protein